MSRPKLLTLIRLLHTKITRNLELLGKILENVNNKLWSFLKGPGVKRNLCRCEIYDVCEIYDPNPNPNTNPIPCEILDVEILDACADSPIVINFASHKFRATPDCGAPAGIP